MDFVHHACKAHPDINLKIAHNIKSSLAPLEPHQREDILQGSSPALQ